MFEDNYDLPFIPDEKDVKRLDTKELGVKVSGKAGQVLGWHWTWERIETVPRNGQEVLLYGEETTASIPIVTTGWFDPDRNEFRYLDHGEDGDGEYKLDNVTHWTFLPEPPEEK